MKTPPSLKAYEKPKAPSMLQVAYREDMLILSWSYPDNLRAALKGFVVLRSEDGGFERIGLIAGDESSYTDRNFKLNHTYRCKVVAQSQKDVLSSDSQIIIVTPAPLPPPPEKIRFSVSPDSIELSWDSSGEGVCYNIYKSAVKGSYGGAPINKEPVCSTSFKDTIITPDRTIFYVVRALSSRGTRGEGYASAEVEVASSNFIPSPPSDLRITRGDDAIFLNWKESPESWVKGYRIYRRGEGEKGFAFIGEVKTPFLVDRQKIDKKVRYQIRALGPAAEGGPLEGE